MRGKRTMGMKMQINFVTYIIYSEIPLVKPKYNVLHVASGEESTVYVINMESI
jgi:hypothetical protein